MRSKLLTFGLAALVISTAFGASAFTTGSVKRSQQITVADDQNALIGFRSGSNIATINDGTLSLNPSFANANGVNDKGTFRFGNLTNSDSTPTVDKSTFVITNNDNVSHTFKVEFSTDDSGNTVTNVKFEFYYINDSGTLKKSSTTITDETTSVKVIEKEGSSTNLSVDPNQELYVVVTVMTNNGAVDNGSTIDGTFEITAT